MTTEQVGEVFEVISSIEPLAPVYSVNVYPGDQGGYYFLVSTIYHSSVEQNVVELSAEEMAKVTSLGFFKEVMIGR